jgi:hypothetical protein
MTLKDVLELNLTWNKLMIFLAKDARLSAAFIAAFNELLDEMLEEDAFGTEGQCDPRGDHRE